MKLIVTTILGVTLTLVALNSTGATKALSPVIEALSGQAKDQIHLFSQLRAGSDMLSESWYVESSAQNKVIIITVLFTEQEADQEKSWHKKFTIEPGQILRLATRTQGGHSSLQAQVSSACYL